MDGLPVLLLFFLLSQLPKVRTFSHSEDSVEKIFFLNTEDQEGTRRTEVNEQTTEFKGKYNLESGTIIC